MSHLIPRNHILRYLRAYLRLSSPPPCFFAFALLCGMVSPNQMIRQRAGKQPSKTDGHFVASHNDSETTHQRRQRKEHISVWIRYFWIIFTFAMFSALFSKRTRHGLYVRSGSNSNDLLINTINANGNPRFVTIVMPSVVNPQARPFRLSNIAKTWGPTSRAVYVVHSVDEFSEGANNLLSTTSKNNPYPQLLKVPDNINVEMGVERLDMVIRTVHKDVNPDFAFFVNDHTFVIPDNLCKFLNDRDSADDLYAGHALKGKQETIFNSGAAGYVLSRSTMEKLIAEWDTPNSKCSASGASKWIQGNPGLLTAKCFDEVLKIPVVDTRDKNLSHIFHAFGLVRSVTGNVDEWYINKHDALDGALGVDPVYHHKPQDGAMCCSSSTVSFHYVEGLESVALWKVLETVHSEPTMSTEEIKKLINDVWPVGRNELGFYSHGLPNSNVWWNGIVEVVRKIAIAADPQKSC